MNFNKPLIIALAMASLLWLAYVGVKAVQHTSYLNGYADAKADSAQATSRALEAQYQQLNAEFNRQLGQANKAVTALRQANQAIAKREQQLRQEINHVTTHYRDTPAARPEPLPECIFTTGFVGLYNQAISPAKPGAAAVPAATPAAGANRAASTTAPVAATADPLQPSNIGQRDILQHITEYGSRCQQIETQLIQLLDYLEKINNRSTADGS